MRSVTYAYLGAESEAAKFGKKGTASDITLFNAKKDDAHLNLVIASRFPEKATSLCLALDLADAVVLHPERVDRALGEAVVAVELFGKARGFLRPGPDAGLEAVRPLLAKTALRELVATDEPEATFRERLFDFVASPAAGPTVVPVDHAFPVKGVGTVALGLVRRGEVRVHDALQAYPGRKAFEVRSVQVHDIDEDAAPRGARVGLALKGAEPDDVPRGTVLAAPGTLRVLPANETLTLEARLSPFSKWGARPGSVLRLFHALQDVPLRVATVEPPASLSPRIAGKLDAPLTVVPGQPAVLVDLDNKQQRFVGSAALPTR